LWKSYFPSVDAVVYLIDANDKERFPEAKKELDVIMMANEKVVVSDDSVVLLLLL
jgi:GTP-binding protein SAR1